MVTMPATQYPFVLTEKLGADGCSALVGMIDDRHQSLIHTLNGRFDDQDQRLAAQFDAIDERFDDQNQRLAAQFDAIDERFDDQNQRLAAQFDAIDERLDALNQRLEVSFMAVGQQFGALEHHFVALDRSVDDRLAHVGERFERRLLHECSGIRQDIVVGLHGVRTEMANHRADLLKWAMVFWISQAAAVASIIAALG
jgi:hypothetical protein